MRRSVIPASVIVLSLLSLVTLSSIAPSLVAKQLTFFLIGFAIFWVISRVSFNHISEFRLAAYVGLVGLLVVTLAFGQDTRNTARWISVGGLFVIQGSQLAIPIVGLLMSHMLSTTTQISFSRLFTALVTVAIPAALILISPDLGTTLAFVASVGVSIFLSRTKLWHLAALAAVGLILIVLSWEFILHDYQRARLSSFLDSQDIQGASYNARQALIAVGSGGMFGRGLGQGVQSHLRFLPERQTDFVFASFSEEFGFVGGSILILTYGLLVTAILRIGMRQEQQSAELFCYIVAAMVVVQAGVNIGMNIGLLPITGITLPLMSYGGSSILSISGTLGIVQALANQHQQRETRYIH